MQKPVCRHCKSDAQVKLRRRIVGNGAETVLWYCLACNRGAELNEPAIKRDTVNAYLAHWRKTVADLPIVEDYTQTSPPCIVCGRQDTEYNHWLPQMFADRPEVAPEWSQWSSVGAPLCRHHHTLWHRIVTPYMPGIGRTGNHDDNNPT